MSELRRHESNSYFRRLLQHLRPRRTESARGEPRSATRRLRLEPLEDRCLLATDLASITGLVSINTAVSGATIRLYEDDGDGVFEPGAGDALLATTTTDGAGRYSFERLSAGDYWVQQPAQVVGATHLGEFISPLIPITAAEAQGIAGTQLDDFLDSVAQFLVADSTTPTDAASKTHAASFGGERDLLVEFTSGGPGEAVQLDSQSGRLAFSATPGGRGRFVATYDGPDGNPTTIDFTGLGGVDLTNSGVSNSILVRARVDVPSTQVQFRIYTDDVSFSDSAVLTIPGNDEEFDLVFEFSDFVMGTGASAEANFASVGAIEMTMVTAVDGAHGRVTLLSTFGPTVKTQNITNEADLAVTKTVDNPFPAVGQDVVFTITVHNLGPAGATRIEIQDIIPSGMAFVSANESQGQYDNNNSIWAVGGLAKNATATLEITAKMLTLGEKTNTAEIHDVDQPDPNSANNSDDATVTAALADLSIEKEVDVDRPNRGQEILFTVTVSNVGPDQATGVVVEDLLPAGLTFVTASASQGSYASGTGVWAVGTLAASASATLEITATVAAPGAKVNSAEITAADQPDPLAANNEASVTVTPNEVDLSVSKSVDNDTPDLNSEIAFTVIVSNAGPSEATGIAIEDRLPAGLVFVSATATAGLYDDSTGIWTLASLADGAFATLTIVATVTSTAALTNTAQIVAVDQFDTDAGNDEAGVIVDAPDLADLAVTKTVTNDRPNLDDEITFTITIVNFGPDGATGVEVTDSLPSGMTFVSATASQGTYSSTSNLWLVGDVDDGQTATLSIVARVDTFGAKINTVGITASDLPDPDTDNNVDNVTVTPLQIDLSVTKGVDVNRPNRNQQIVFTITVENDGPDEATGVIVEDVLLPGLTFVTATASQGNYSSSTGSWTVGSLASGATATLEIAVTVTAAGAKTNTAQVIAADQADADSTPANNEPGEDDQASIVVTPNQADLSVSKSATTQTPALGSNVSFTITVGNSGPDNATGVVVQDSLPSGLTFVSANASQGSYSSSTGLWTLGALNNGLTATLTIVATVTSTAAITNTAQISASDQFDTNANNNQVSVTVDAPDTADLSVTKSVNNASPLIGQNVAFTIGVGNAGPDGASGVQVTDALPSGMTFVSATASQGSYSSSTGIWLVGALNSGAAATLTIVATMNTVGAKVNTAEITAADQPDSSEANNSASVTVTGFEPGQVDISVAKTVDNASPNRNATVVFTVTAGNAGPDAATGVVITDALPAGLTFVSAQPSQGNYNSGTGVWTVGTLASGGSATLQITATVATSGVKTNSAALSASDQLDPNANNNQASITLTPNVADLSLAKTADISAPGRNQNVTFTITVSNAGPNNATGVSVTDLLPAGMTFVSSTATQGAYDSATGVWTVGAVNSSATATLTIVAAVTTIGAKSNTASIAAADQFDSNADNNQVTITVTPAVADLAVTKSASSASPSLGQNVVFTITVSNAGPSQATNVAVRDVLPAGLTFLTASASQGAYASATGIWTVGTLASSSSASLEITATVSSIGSKTNSAEISASDQFDSNAQNNQASITLGTPQRLSKRLFLARTPRRP